MRPDLASLAERVALALGALGVAPRALPLPFFDAYLAPLGARAVITATRAGLTAELCRGPATAQGLAAELSLDPQGVDLLLGVLVTLGYAKRRPDGRFALTPVARRWLAPDTMDAVVGCLAHDAWATVEHLDERLRGAPATGWHERPPEDPMWEPYQRSMAQLARLSAEPVAKAIPVDSPRRLLDLGGAHGLHALAMCRRHPSLHATVVDLPPAVRFGRELLAHEPAGERVEHREGDLFTTELGDGWDVVTTHSVLHNFPPERCVELLVRARRALAPNGTFAALELERAPAGRRGARAPAVNALLFFTFAGGRTYRADELEAMLAEAGFRRIRVKRPPRLPGNVLVLARP